MALFESYVKRRTRQGLVASLRARDSFGRYLPVGVTTMIVVQAFFNISVVLALLPTKGIPLPFISCTKSYGGFEFVCDAGQRAFAAAKNRGASWRKGTQSIASDNKGK